MAGTVLDDGGTVFHVFMLADGRLAEYRPEGFSLGPPGPDQAPRGSFGKWSLHEVPESEGGNAAYCSVHKGLNHCLLGTRPAGQRADPRGTSDESAWTGTHPAGIRDEWTPSQGVGPGPGSAAGTAAPRVRPGAALPSAPASLQLRVMDPRSLLVIGKGATLHERSFSGRVKQAWVRHKHPQKLVRIAATLQSAMLALDEKGALYVWEFKGKGRWDGPSQRSAAGWPPYVAAAPRPSETIAYLCQSAAALTAAPTDWRTAPPCRAATPAHSRRRGRLHRVAHNRHGRQPRLRLR